jgi:hypothetical protein
MCEKSYLSCDILGGGTSSDLLKMWCTVYFCHILPLALPEGTYIICIIIVKYNFNF